MIELAWTAYDDADCDSFNVYRSIPGIVVPFPNALLAGDVLTFAATSVDKQNITFSATDIDSFVSTFNATAKGAVAAKDALDTQVFIRVTATSRAKLKIYPCTAASSLAITPRTIVPALEWSLVSNVPFVVNTFDYTYTDDDGTELDAFRITSLVGAVESLPSLLQFPQIGVDSLCAIEGRACDSQNRPVQGLVIRAEPRLYETYSDGHGVDVHSCQAISDAYGRFTLYLPRKTIYLLQIPNVGYNETVCVPDLPAAGFADLIPTLAARFSPFGDPI